jgi:hypothetical protein
VSARLVVLDERNTPSTPAIHVLKILGSAPKLSKLDAGGCLKKSKRCAKPGIHVHFTLSAGAKVTLTLRRKGHKHVVQRKVVDGRAGANSARLGVRGLHAGRYVLTASPAGGAAVRAGFRAG